MESASEQQAAQSGIVAGLTAIWRNLLGLALCRLELASLELAEARAALVQLAVLFALAVLAVWFALAGWTSLIVVLAWDSLGWKILAIVAAVFTVAAAALIWHARSILAQNKLSLPATMAELRNDRDALL